VLDVTSTGRNRQTLVLLQRIRSRLYLSTVESKNVTLRAVHSPHHELVVWEDYRSKVSCPSMHDPGVQKFLIPVIHLDASRSRMHGDSPSIRHFNQLICPIHRPLERSGQTATR
jgi:hypothetical protein